MKPKFDSPFEVASSAPVESDFGELKQRILRFDTRPMSVDRFVSKHLLSIDSNAKLFRSAQLRHTRVKNSISINDLSFLNNYVAKNMYDENLNDEFQNEVRCTHRSLYNYNSDCNNSNNSSSSKSEILWTSKKSESKIKYTIDKGNNDGVVENQNVISNIKHDSYSSESNFSLISKTSKIDNMYTSSKKINDEVGQNENVLSDINHDADRSKNESTLVTKNSKSISCDESIHSVDIKNQNNVADINDDSDDSEAKYSLNSEISLNNCENWHGKGKYEEIITILKSENVKKPRITAYMLPTPEIGQILNKKNTRSNLTILLRNGNVMTPVHLSKSKYILCNTCPFDSICFFIVMAYIDHPQYKSYIDTSNNCLLKLCKNLALNGSSVITYKNVYKYIKPYLKKLMV